MPVYGLPVTLEILLESLVQGQVLKNLNVFSNIQSIVVKFNVVGPNNSHGLLTNTGQSTPVNMPYKMKAPSQVKRDVIRKMNR